MACGDSTCDELREQYQAVLALLSVPSGSFSDKGRSVSVQSKDVHERLKLLAGLMAANGCADAPSVVPAPYFGTSRMRA